MAVSSDLGTSLQETFVYLNPPLSPSGVQRVIDYTKTTLEDTVVDIVFEPASNCFRILIYQCGLHTIRSQLAYFVTTLHQEAVPDLDDDLDSSSTGTGPAASETTTDPHFLEWGAYQSQICPALYGDTLYPDSLHQYSHKVVWYGAERLRTTVSQLLEDGRETWLRPYIPQLLESLESELNCEVTWNVPETILYLGGEKDAVTLAVRKLDLLGQVTHPSNLIQRHLVVARETAHLGCKSLKLLCLDRKTLVVDDLGLPSKKVPCGASLRLAYFDRQKNSWVTDTTKYQDCHTSSKAVTTQKPTSQDATESPLRYLDALKTCLSVLTGFLHRVPGLVHLELTFGRVWLTNVESQELSLEDRANPTWTAKQMEQDLNEPTMGYKDDFSSILTTCRDDIRLLLDAMARGEARWRKEPETATTYVIRCATNSEDPFQIHVSEDKKFIRFLSTRKELSVTTVHCPQTAWDMKLRAIRQEPLSISKGGRAQKIADGMETLQQKGGALTMTFPKALSWCIESVFVVHIECYHSRKNSSSLLKVKTTRPLRPLSSKDRSQWCSSAVAKVPDVTAAPTEWIETSITSSILECCLGENVALAFGEAPAWSVADLEAAGAFDDICRPALGMITQMDRVGQRNIYSESASRSALGTASQEGNAEREGYVYW